MLWVDKLMIGVLLALVFCAAAYELALIQAKE